MKEDIKDEFTNKIIECAMKVNSTLGNGFQELIYQRALAIEMQNQGIAFLRELEMPLYYDNKYIGTRRVDYLVEDAVMDELKAFKIEDVHLTQGLNYLVSYKTDKGLLIHVVTQSLEFKRLRHPKNKQNPVIQQS